MRLEDVIQDLRTPLVTARASLEMVLKDWSELTEDKRLELVSRSLLAVHQLDFASDRAGKQVALDSRRGGPRRPELIDLTVEEQEGPSTAHITLKLDGDPLSGSATSRNGLRIDPALAPRATLQALDPLLQGRSFRLEDAGVLQIGEAPFAVVRIRQDDDLLVGSALIESDLHLSMARATLDALNRVVTRPRRTTPSF
jgi:hypothetical protein